MQIIEDKLTNNELKILNLIVKGMEDIEIAETLSLNEEKIKETIQALHKKFKTKRRIELAIYAVKKNVVCY